MAEGKSIFKHPRYGALVALIITAVICCGLAFGIGTAISYPYYKGAGTWADIDGTWRLCYSYDSDTDEYSPTGEQATLTISNGTTARLVTSTVTATYTLEKTRKNKEDGALYNYYACKNATGSHELYYVKNSNSQRISFAPNGGASFYVFLKVGAGEDE